MTTTIRLLGPPRIDRDGAPVSLGGRKPWALLTCLLLERAGQTRPALAERLCADADDPLGALRWNLLQARRAIKPSEIVEQDGRLSFHATLGTEVDVHVLQDAVVDPGRVEELVGGTLLEGMAFDDAPAFDRWLMLERSRIATATADAIRWAATMLSRTDGARALSLIERGLRADPFDDALHELVVDIHMSRGDRAAADAYIADVQRRYADELDVEIPESILRPVERTLLSPGAPAVPPAVEARALLARAETQLDGADFARALETTRRAAASAAASGDRRLEARALMLLAGALIHTIHGRDHESHGLLARALHVATELEDPVLLAEIERLNGFIGLIDARYGAAETTLTRSMRWAADADDVPLAAKARTFRGMCEDDRGDFARAEDDLRTSLEELTSEEHRGYRGYTRAGLARVLIRTGRIADARAAARVALDEVETGGMHGSAPWALCQLGEAALLDGDRDAAREAFDHSWALALEFADPCWESLSLRGFALCAAREGNREEATRLLSEGLARARRETDTYRWVEASILTDLVELQDGSEPNHIRDAARLALAGPMPDLAERLTPFLGTQTPLQTPAR